MLTLAVVFASLLKTRHKSIAYRKVPSICEFYNNCQTFSCVDWLVAIAYERIDNKNYVRCNVQPFKTKIKRIPLMLFSFYCKKNNNKQIDDSFLWFIILHHFNTTPRSRYVRRASSAPCHMAVNLGSPYPRQENCLRRSHLRCLRRILYIT